MIETSTASPYALILLLVTTWCGFAVADETAQVLMNTELAKANGERLVESVRNHSEMNHLKTSCPTPHVQPMAEKCWYKPWSWFASKPARGSAAVCSGLPGGCNTHPDPVFGGSYYATMQAQISKGEAALMVLYHYDFEPGRAELNYRGRLQMHKNAQRMQRNDFPLVIEESRDNHELDIARYSHVISELASLSISIPPERVVIGRPTARGLDGLDAELVHENLLRQTIGGGASAPAPPVAPATP